MNPQTQIRDRNDLSTTYARALLFLLPPVAIWTLVRAKCVPILVSIAENQNLGGGNAAPFLNLSLFLAQYGFWILLSLMLGLAALEFGAKNFAERRRVVVGGFVWIVNAAVICVLAALFTAAVIIAPALVR